MNRDKVPALIEAVESRTKAFASLLPSTIPPQKFIAAVKTALLTVAGLSDCDKQSVVLACMRCAADGLVPDGRDAVLVVGRTRRSDGGWGHAAQYWAMSQGLQKIAYRTGMVLRLETRLVHQGDGFELTLGSAASVRHKPDFGKNKGEVVGAYCIATLKSGDQYIEWMDREEIDGIMRRSKSWDRNANAPKGPWASDWGEMARKTVLRRALKYLPSEAALAGHSEDEEPSAEEGELIEGTLSAPMEAPIGNGGTITSGKSVEAGARPVEEPAKVEEAEMLDLTAEPPAASQSDASRREPIAPPPPPKRHIPGDDVLAWKAELRKLRDDVLAAPDKEHVEQAWTIWDESYTEVPVDVTAAAKARVDARLYELARGG